ncbi:hypothetical protein M9H77_04924 [Catharanthus roseus]|uniref:Uncharacterized protein n=1 Tax=Catharanthus roseus TaxID=4058 RepID=A0ACC0CG11_CATRO|nr:hypothetical protein M9H77_04924 [Catharanthus roseus]
MASSVHAWDTWQWPTMCHSLPNPHVILPPCGCPIPFHMSYLAMSLPPLQRMLYMFTVETKNQFELLKGQTKLITEKMLNGLNQPPSHPDPSGFGHQEERTTQTFIKSNYFSNVSYVGFSTHPLTLKTKRLEH